MARTSYVIAVGSNRRGRHGDPRAEVRAALAELILPCKGRWHRAAMTEGCNPLDSATPLRPAAPATSPCRGGFDGRIASPTITSIPIGPSQRRYANAVAVIEYDRDPPALLAWLKGIERAFGRRRGRRWGARVIDLDIVLWSRGAWNARGLTVPHVAFRSRGFVLGPLAEVAAGWRDPLSGLSVRQLSARLTARRAALSRRRLPGAGS